MPVMQALWFRVTLAFLLDLILGDPRWLPHPVVAMGKLTAALEKVLRQAHHPPGWQRLAGSLLVVTVVGLAALCGVLAVGWATSAHPLVGLAVEVLLIYTSLATRSLGDHLVPVYRALDRGDLSAARRAVSLVVGRDTAGLDEAEVARAAVESAAESTSDGIVAPLFFAFLGGAPGALAYRAVNTLDSMLGYRDERYRFFGWGAARLDDLANLVPARLSAALLLAAGAVRGYDWRRALRILRRDARAHPSPNSGYPEAAMAGLLGVRLGGPNRYRGVPSFRPYLGEPGRPLQAGDVRAALALVTTAAGLALICGAGLSALGLTLCRHWR
ncbi:MAG: adenosylcobinamide-phosphate synthase CbiB [Bacillota bacterium]|nr:adenosylcobinamide-phosphate synthase CbiB [Bacillota bacterium]